eukprot:15434266-Alexandrium_andersonii.AAC.1
MKASNDRNTFERAFESAFEVTTCFLRCLEGQHSNFLWRVNSPFPGLGIRGRRVPLQSQIWALQ